MFDLPNDEILSLSKEHVFYTWSAQAKVNPLAVQRAKGVYFWDMNDRQYLDFNSSNRAQCPVCLTDGKKDRNISISPEGKIKCHQDCSFPDILNALGIDTKAPANQAPAAKRIAPNKAIVPDKKPVYKSQQEIEANHQTLLTQSKIAKEWLLNRGIDEQAIARYKLGIAKYSFKGKTYPCITIPYNRKG